MNMDRVVSLFKYFFYVSYHKICIFIVGIYFNWRLRSRLHLPYHRLLFHDWVKFDPIHEFPQYAKKFFGKCNLQNPQDALEWNEAWKHHYTRMDHHWQYHVTGYTTTMTSQQIVANARLMPDEAAMELVVDVMGSQLSYNGSWPTNSWFFLENAHLNQFYHTNTHSFIVVLLNLLGFQQPLQVCLLNL